MPISAEQRRTIAPALDALETIRQRYKNEHLKRKKTVYTVLSMVLVIAGGILFHVLMEQQIPISFWVALLVAVVGWIGASIYAQASVTAFQKEFKGKAYCSVVTTLYPGMTYRPQNGLSIREFNASKLFSRPDRYNGEDYFTGQTENNCTIEFSEIHAEQEHTHTDEDGDTTTSYSTLFKGLFFALHLPQNIQRDIRVLPDTAERGLGKLGKFLQKSLGSFFRTGKMVYFEEHPEFEKEFVVYSTNEQAARNALTTTVLEDIYDLKYEWEHEVRLSFINDRIYLALSMPEGDNLFHVDINQPVDQQEFLYDMVQDIQCCLTMVEHLGKVHQGSIQEANDPFTKIEHPPVQYKKSASKDNPFLL